MSVKHLFLFIPQDSCTLFLFLVFLFFHIVENILYIFVFLKTFDQLFDRSALFGCYIFHIVRNTFEFGTDDFITGLFEMMLDIIILRELAIKYDFFLIGLHFIGFVYSTPIVMFLVSLMLGLRHWLIGIVCYVLFTLLLNYVAFNFMQIILPTGVLFG
mgnify:CR=1 FL=1